MDRIASVRVRSVPDLLVTLRCAEFCDQFIPFMCLVRFVVTSDCSVRSALNFQPSAFTRLHYSRAFA